MVEVLLDQDGVMLYKPGQLGRFRKAGKADHNISKGVLVAVTVINKDTLKLKQTGRQKLAPKREDEDKTVDFLHE